MWLAWGRHAINRPWNAIIRDVTSGVPQMTCWGEFYIVTYCGNMAYVQTAAASRGREIPSCLGTNPEFQHRPFQKL